MYTEKQINDDFWGKVSINVDISCTNVRPIVYMACIGQLNRKI
jgi:hypothetical protein